MDYQRAGVAETYRRVRSLPPATIALWRGVLRELASIGGVSLVADVGCGTGRFTACLAEAWGARIVALDPSTRMLAAAERHAAARYVAGEAQALPLATGHIDVAFLSMVWHHLPEPRAAAAELARILRPGGAVVLRTATADLLDDYVFLRFFPESRALDQGRLPSRSALRALFAAAGFAGTAHRTVEQRVAESAGEYLVRVRERSFSSLQGISDAAFAHGLARFEAWCASRPAAEPVHEPVDVFIFRR